jgi:hypothetical protein
MIFDHMTPLKLESVPAGGIRCRGGGCHADSMRVLTWRDRFGVNVVTPLCGRHAAEAIHALGIYDGTMNPDGKVLRPAVKAQ